MTSKLVCPLGRFNLLCSTNGAILEWTIDIPESSGIVDPGNQRIRNTTPPEVHSFVIRDSTFLLISRISLSPLTSLLEINNTIAALNGTRIDCTQSMTEMFSLVITIIGNGK